MPLSGTKILVVEDNEDLVFLWQSLLLRLGADARFVSTGEDALHSVQEGFDAEILMTDYFLPDMTGDELIRNLQGRKQDLKCLIITGNTEFNLRNTPVPNSKLLFKPVRFDLLKEALMELKSLKKD